MGKFKDVPERGGLQKEEHLHKIAQMYLRGFTQTEIGTKLEISQPTVSNDLTFIRERWRQSSLVNFHEREAAELEKIDALEEMYFDGFKRSLRKRSIKTQKKVPYKKGEDGNLSVSPDGELQEDVAIKYLTVEETLREEIRDGDQRWLEGIGKCIDVRCKILGLYRTTPGSQGGGDGGADKSIEGRVTLLLGIFEQYGQDKTDRQIRPKGKSLDTPER